MKGLKKIYLRYNLDILPAKFRFYGEKGREQISKTHNLSFIARKKKEEKNNQKLKTAIKKNQS